MFMQSNITLAHMEDVGHLIEKVRNCLGNKNGESVMSVQDKSICVYLVTPWCMLSMQLFWS